MTYKEELMLKKRIYNDFKHKNTFVSILFGKGELVLSETYKQKREVAMNSETKKLPKLKLKDFRVSEEAAKKYEQYDYLRSMQTHFYDFARDCEYKSAIKPTNQQVLQLKKEQAQTLMHTCENLLDMFHLIEYDAAIMEDSLYLKNIIDEVCEYNPNQYDNFVVGNLILDMKIFTHEHTNFLDKVNKDCKKKNPLGIEEFVIL